MGKFLLILLMARTIAPITCKEPGRYSRLFPHDPQAIQASDSRLDCLAWKMCEKETGAPVGAGKKIPAAYTYIGQFIDHDMTLEPAKVSESGPNDPCDMANRRTNPLNLEAVYGAPYQSMEAGILEDDGLRFRLGDRENQDGVKFDVPVHSESKAPLVADRRNLENAIIRQVHVMFLRLHNVALRETPTFAEARRRVSHQYQWLVVHDFLDKICEPRGIGDPLVDWRSQFAIPIEFSRAGFRFGHSMVRGEYDVGEITGTVPLLLLLGGEGPNDALPRGHAVRWPVFFNIPGAGSSESALPIDSSVVMPLFYLPPPPVMLFRSDLPKQDNFILPRITLQRGAASQLPAGPSVRKALGLPDIKPSTRGYDPWADIKACGIPLEQIPLWYYILVEAEAKHGGRRLGPVGSFIVREVIMGALWANKESYLNEHGPDWVPPKWPMPKGNKKKEIRTFYDLASVVGLAN